MPEISVRGLEMPESPIRKLAPLAADAKKRGISPLIGIRAQRFLTHSQNTKNAILISRNKGNASPTLAINGWLAGLIWSLNPTASMAIMVATFAPAIMRMYSL